jgi:hypothetical protein
LLVDERYVLELPTEEVSVRVHVKHREQMASMMAHVIVTDAIQHAAQLLSRYTKEEWLEIQERTILEYSSAFQRREEERQERIVQERPPIQTAVHMQRPAESHDLVVNFVQPQAYHSELTTHAQQTQVRIVEETLLVDDHQIVVDTKFVTAPPVHASMQIQKPTEAYSSVARFVQPTTEQTDLTVYVYTRQVEVIEETLIIEDHQLIVNEEQLPRGRETFDRAPEEQTQPMRDHPMSTSARQTQTSKQESLAFANIKDVRTIQHVPPPASSFEMTRTVVQEQQPQGYPPVFEQVLYSQNADEGDVVQFETVVHGYPVPDIFWLIDSNPIANSA